VSQHLIDDFARASGDSQWIHVDVARAQRESPYGATVAHGFLTLSLLSRMFHESCSVRASASINYGLERVRFVSPVRSGTYIRGVFSLTEIRAIDGGADVRWHVEVHIQDGEKPALVAEWLLRWWFA
jgi:acyl dehydratase